MPVLNESLIKVFKYVKDAVEVYSIELKRAHHINGLVILGVNNTGKRQLSSHSAQRQVAREEDGQGNSRLFLKIKGTTDDYRILYDTEAVKKKIVSDFKKEVQELKDAFRSKGKKQEKEVEVSKEEYFDW